MRYKRQLRAGLVFIIFVYAFIANLCISSAQGGGRMMASEFRDRLEAEWRKIRNTAEETASGPVVWSYRVSPPFPAFWPPNSSRKAYYYIYAAGNYLRGGLSDGDLVAPPWARIGVSGEASEMELLSDRLRRIGVQGVRPLSGAEADVYAQSDQTERYLLGLSSQPDDMSPKTQTLKKYYCIWTSHNGIIADALRPRQETFIRWLDCK